MPLLNTTGKRIRILRIAVELDQRQLADRVGVTQSTISMLENDQRQLQVEVARLLAAELNTTAAYLLCLVNTPDPEAACVPA